MAVLKVTVNDKEYIIDAASKASAKKWGSEKLDVKVEEATGDDITAFMTNGGTIEKVLPAPKKVKAEGDAPTGTTAA